MKRILTVILSCILIFSAIALGGCGCNCFSCDTETPSTGGLEKPNTNTTNNNDNNSSTDKKDDETDNKPDTTPDTTPSDPSADEAYSLQGVNYAVSSYSGNMSTWDAILDNNSTSTPAIIASPYFSNLKINDIAVPVYTERSYRGPHSFAYVNVTGIDKVDGLKVSFTTHTTRINPIVLPESTGVKATISGTTVTATLYDYDIYTFTFDRGNNSQDGSKIPLTIMVKHYEEPTIPSDYTKVEVEPGTYTAAQTDYSEQTKKFYWFKRGQYTMQQMTLGSDSTYYFEPGCVINITDGTFADGSHIYYGVSCFYQKNVKVIGNVAFDFSQKKGSRAVEGINDDPHYYGASFIFKEVDNVELSGINTTNSGAWTFSMRDCDNVIIKDVIAIAYRTFSDGIALSNCQNANVSGCFVRTGDDSIEVKSINVGTPTDNVVFEYNDVWTEKGIGYGATFEDSEDQNNVIWRNNTIGFGLSNWSEHLGCMTICMEGELVGTINQNLHFEDIEIYTSYMPVFTICLHRAGNVRNIYLENITAKCVELADVFRKPIDVMVLNHANGHGGTYVKDGPISDFSIGDLYFDNVIINGNYLTKTNKEDLISTKLAPGFVFDMNNVKINKNV